MTLFENYQKHWNIFINFQFLSSTNCWIDIGKEIVHSAYRCHRTDINDPCSQDNNSCIGEYGSSSSCYEPMAQPYTYIWRRSCLKKKAEQFKLDVPRAENRAEYYPWALTFEGANMTLTPGKRHPLRLAGLVYSQYYSSAKEIFDAAKTYPWEDKALEGLTIDSTLHQQWKAASKFRRNGWNPKKVKAVYMASKLRVFQALKNAPFRSYGTREEHRISISLLHQIGQRLEQRGLSNQSPQLQHIPFIAIPTHLLIDYLKSNIIKYCFGFEYSLVRSGSNSISPEDSQMAIMFLYLLRACYTAFPIKRISGLWYSERLRPFNNQNHYGLGLKHTLQRYGHGFFTPDLIQWSMWQFYPHIKNRLLFGIWQVQKPYNSADRQAHTATTFYSTCDLLTKYLADTINRTNMNSSDINRRLQIVWKWICENLVWFFQQEVVQACQQDMKADRIPEDGLQNENIYFSVAVINRYMKSNIHLVKAVSNGRENPKTPFQRLQHL